MADLDYVPGKPVAYWERQLRDAEQSEAATRKTGFVALIIGGAGLLLCWLIMNVTHIIYVWLWAVAGFFALGGLFLMITGPNQNSTELKKARANLQRARQEQTAPAKPAGDTTVPQTDSVPVSPNPVPDPPLPVGPRQRTAFRGFAAGPKG